MVLRKKVAARELITDQRCWYAFFLFFLFIELLLSIM